MDLREDYVLRWSVLRSPGSYGVVQGSDLARLVATKVERPKQREQGGGLQRTVTLELADDPWPVGCEWVSSRPVTAGLFELAGELAKPLIATGGAHTHPSTGSCPLLSAA